MDESWEKAMESALEGHAESSSSSSPRTLTLDGAVKCLHGRLPPPSLLERFSNLEHLSIANIGLSSLESFPKLHSLQRLILSDNRIAGGLEFLVEAGLDSIRDLDLSNNRIQSVEDLAPLANLRLVSLDLYECPVTRVKDYRSRVFGMIPSLKYLDKMDADGNERPESDDEEEEEDEEEYDEEEIDGEDPGNSEIDGDDQAKMVNGSGAVGNGDVDEDEDEESDADEEETETGRSGNGVIHHSNGFHVAAVGARRDDDEEDVDEEDEDDDYEEEDEDLGEGEEINEDEDGEEEDVVEAQDVVDSDEEDAGDGVEEGDGGEDEDEDEDDVEDAAEGEPGSTDRLVSTEGEIDGHEQGEEDDENAGEIGEADDDQGLREDRDSEEDEEDGESEDEEDDLDGEFLVQPIPQQERAGGRGGRSEIDACNEEDEDEDEVDDTEQYRLSNVVTPPQPSSPLQPNKRRRDEDGDESVDEGLRSSKHH